MTNDELRDALMDISGVGEATADEILEVHENFTYSTETTNEIRDLADDMVDAHDAGRHAYAEKYARRLQDAL